MRRWKVRDGGLEQTGLSLHRMCLLCPSQEVLKSPQFLFPEGTTSPTMEDQFHCLHLKALTEGEALP